MNSVISEAGSVNVAISRGIATVSFYHPMSNSLPGKLLRQLADVITDTGNDKDVRVVILKSEGEKAFCAGASFDELSQINDLETGLEFFSGFAAVINALRNIPHLVLGRVQGKAVGGGVGVACATDYCLATTAAAVKLSELAVGIGPFVVGPAVERKIGTSAMSQLAINATEWYSAEWALQKGMYAAIYSTAAELDQAVMALAERLAASNPEAMAELKKTFWAGTENWNSLLMERAAISGKLVMSNFSKASIAKFKAGSRS
jgi:methylglutaconyl-CoA hydratase